VSGANPHGAAGNPFSSRRVRPGAIPYLFAGGESAAELIGRLEASGWWGQIVGPHGSGKSALLATLAPAIEATGRSTLRIELRDGCRRLPLDVRRAVADEGCQVVIVDGYEQLGRLARFGLKRLCRRAGLGLLVTAHADVGLPLLCRTTADLATAGQIVARLQQGTPSPVDTGDVAAAFARRGGNLREVLFDLYDLYEARRPNVN